MRMKLLWITLIGMTFLSAELAASQPVHIGVLAKNGPVRAMKMWKSTADYLSKTVPDRTFKIVPLDFEAVNPAIENGEVDFFLVNSSMFVTAEIKYGAEAVATMINARQGMGMKSFGGVILTASENDAIHTIRDLKGKTFMAVKDSSFGGWQMAYKELIDQGMDPFKDLQSLEFGGKHENVVLAVLNGAVDAGTVRTDTLERMVANGLIEMNEFKIIHPQHHEEFPFVCSTALYPEWPLAKTGQTPPSLVTQTVNALKQLTPQDQAAIDAKVVGWTDPLDYSPVEELQRTLKVGAFRTD